MQALPSLHDIEIVIRPNVEDVENLIKQTAVLACDGDPAIKVVWRFAQPANHWRELNCLGPRAKHEEYALQNGWGWRYL